MKKRIAICSKCKTTPTPRNNPGSWGCACAYDPVSGKGHWDNPKLIVRIIADKVKNSFKSHEKVTQFNTKDVEARIGLINVIDKMRSKLFEGGKISETNTEVIELITQAELCLTEETTKCNLIKEEFWKGQLNILCWISNHM